MQLESVICLSLSLSLSLFLSLSLSLFRSRQLNVTYKVLFSCENFSSKIQKIFLLQASDIMLAYLCPLNVNYVSKRHNYIYM